MRFSVLRTVAAVVAAAMTAGAGAALAQSGADSYQQTCTDWYERSDAYDDCGVAAGYSAATITVVQVGSGVQVNVCRVEVGCPKTTTSATGTETVTENSTSFQASHLYMDRLYNDNGVLKMNSN